MKNFKLLIIAILSVVSISSCMKNDNTDDFDYGKAKARHDSVMKAQKPVLLAYAQKNYSADYKYNDSTGMYLDILTPATDNSYEYTLQGGNFIAPQITVKFKGNLLDDAKTVFEDASTAQTFYLNGMSNINANRNWAYAFFPRNVTVNGQSILYGLVDGGVKKGAKVKFLSPSPWAFGQAGRKDNTGKVIVPADTPVEYTVELIDIK